MIKKINKISDTISTIENMYIKKDVPLIEIGDTVKIEKTIQEGNKERIQISEGVVIAKKNSGVNKTFTIRKTIQNVGVEKIYPIHSPQIINISIIKKAKVRRAKLYYLRSRSGKATRLKQKYK